MNLFKREYGFGEQTQRICTYRILLAIIEKEEKGQISPQTMKSLTVYKDYLLEVIQKQIPNFNKED